MDIATLGLASLGRGVTVRINKRPTRGPMIVADCWVQIPVSINFDCFATSA